VLTNAGHSVVSAESGDEGLAMIRGAADPFDVVLLDQLMPGMSGMEVLEQAKNISPALPVIIITGSATEETRKELLAKGACDCLPKPFTPEQLRIAINTARS
jgi:CheY-like chemotaxis protein